MTSLQIYSRADDAALMLLALRRAMLSPKCRLRLHFIHYHSRTSSLHILELVAELYILNTEMRYASPLNATFSQRSQAMPTSWRV